MTLGSAPEISIFKKLICPLKPLKYSSKVIESISTVSLIFEEPTKFSGLNKKFSVLVRPVMYKVNFQFLSETALLFKVTFWYPFTFTFFFKISKLVGEASKAKTFPFGPTSFANNTV